MKPAARALVSALVVVPPVAVPLMTRNRAALRTVALVSSSVTLGLSMSHALELPAKRRLAPAQWWSLTRTLYRPWFGRAGHAEGIALLAVPALAVVDPGSRRRWLTSSAALLLANPVLFFSLVAATNRATLRHGDEVPLDVVALRDRWEFGHLARFGCHLVAFLALVWADSRERQPPHHR